MADDPLAAWLESLTPPDQAAADGTAPAARHAPEARPSPTSPWPSPLIAGLPASGRPDFDEDRSRRRRLIVFAVAPWILAAGLALFLWQPGPGPASAPSPGPAPADAPRGTDLQPSAPPQASPSAAAPNATRRSPTATRGLRAEAALSATATLAVRDALSRPHERGAQYVDHVDGESIEWVGEVAIVTVLAAVLEEQDGRWAAARSARFAVPLQVMEGQPVPVGQPWALAPPARPRAELQWSRAALRPGSAESALAMAGYRDIDDVQAWSTRELPDVARVTAMATAPLERDRRRHDVWLRLGPVAAVLGQARAVGGPQA